MKDIFISHAWGNDELNRDNHKRCKVLADKLIEHGYTVWFDSNEIYGNIDSSIMKGINNCKIVLVCLTRRYCDKINNCAINQLSNDNCYKEWNYSLFKQKIIIPVLMEPCMINIFLHEDGIMQMYLNSLIFVNFSQNLDDDFFILCKNIKNNNIFNNNKKKYILEDSNNLFNKFVYILNDIPDKMISPNTAKKLKKNLDNSKNLINKPKKKLNMFYRISSFRQVIKI